MVTSAEPSESRTPCPARRFGNLPLRRCQVELGRDPAPCHDLGLKFGKRPVPRPLNGPSDHRKQVPVAALGRTGFWAHCVLRRLGSRVSSCSFVPSAFAVCHSVMIVGFRAPAPICSHVELPQHLSLTSRNTIPDTFRSVGPPNLRDLPKPDLRPATPVGLC
jgi:hypothetical protein